VLRDNITQNAKQATAANKELDVSNKAVEASTTDMAIAFIHNITVLSALREGINGIVSSLYILEITNESTNRSLRKIAAVNSLFIDLARSVKGLIALTEMLNGVTATLAGIESYRAFLKNPAVIAVGIGAATAAGGVAGYLLGRKTGGEGGNSYQQTLNFNAPGVYGPGTTDAVKRQALEGMGGY